MKTMKLYEYLQTQFKNEKQAIKFAKKWAQKWEQEFPKELGSPMFTRRAMSYHISRVLEGITDEEEEEYERGKFCTDYLSTKYGSKIYWGMC